MEPNILEDSDARAPWLELHPVREEDSVAVAALRSVVAPMKGKLEGTAARGSFDDIMQRVVAPEGVTFEGATVGGTPAGGPSRRALRKVSRFFTSTAAGSTGELLKRSGTSRATLL